MSQITYFPRYSTKENAVTNTVLHLFAQINNESTERLKELLSKLINDSNDEEIPLGVSFNQQIRNGDSIPDGQIVQEQLKIIIETKVDAGVNLDQLKRHFNAFKKGERSNYLILLTVDQPSPAIFTETNKIAQNSGVTFKPIIFERLYNLLEDFCKEHETHLKHVVEDFRSYCSDMELLPDNRRWLRIVPCGKSKELNKKWNLYYQPTYRSYRSHEYIGIYYDKSVRHIGKIVATYDIDQSGSLVCVEGNDEERFHERIRNMIKETKEQIGWNVDAGHRFFCVDQLENTHFEKTSYGGIQGPRFWDISKILKKDITDKELAERLSEETWK